MSKRSVAAVCREIVMVKSAVADEKVRDKLIADLQAELAELSGVTLVDRQVMLPLEPASPTKADKK